MAKPITKEGYDNVKVKISELKTEFESLPEIIAEAREKGDLKENAEYHAARERQGLLPINCKKWALTEPPIIRLKKAKAFLPIQSLCFVSCCTAALRML